MEKKVCSNCKEEKNIIEFYNGRKKCKYCYSQQKKKYRENNKDVINKKNREYYYNNHEIEKERSREWKKNNIERVIEYNSEYKKTYEKNRIQNDPVYRVKQCARNLIKCSLYQKKFTKNSRTFTILGCTYEEFKIHIESQWKEWMNWDNYGKYNGKENYGWDLDHIIPVSSVNTQEDIIRLNHHSNIQPLCSYNNRCIKRDKL